MFFLVGLTRNSDFVQNKTFLSEGQVLSYFAGTLYLYYDMVFQDEVNVTLTFDNKVKIIDFSLYTFHILCVHVLGYDKVWHVKGLALIFHLEIDNRGRSKTKLYNKVMTTLFQQPSSLSSVAIFQQHQCMEFTFSLSLTRLLPYLTMHNTAGIL